MRFMTLARRSVVVGLATLCSAMLAVTGSTAEPAYDVHSFEGGPAWFVYDEAVDVALHVLKPGDPKCHEIGEIILLFETRDQLRDDDLIEASELTGMNRYAELCRSLGGNPSNQRTVVGIVVGEGEPGSRGYIIGDSKVLDAMVSSLTGEYQLWVRRNAVAIAESRQAASPERDEQRVVLEAEQEAAKQAREQERAAEIAELRATYDAALSESIANAQPSGLVGRLTRGDRAALTGVWSGSQAECAKERVILFENDGTGTVEWWRASHEESGLLPWRTGQWELRDGTVIMSFDHRVELSRATRNLRSGPINETVQFDLESVNGTELRLAATSGGFSPEALFLRGAEKLFVRCR